MDIDDFNDDDEFNSNGKRLHDRREDVFVKRLQRGGEIQFNSSMPEIQFEMIREYEPRLMNNFRRQIYKKVYKAKHNFDKMDILFMGNQIDKIFEDFVKEPMQVAQENDQISVKITNGHLRQPIFVSYMKSNFQLNEIVNKMAELVQSENGRNFILTEEFEIEVAVTKGIYGSGFKRIRNRAPQSSNARSQVKKSVTVIRNNDNACGYWAIALSLFKSKNNDQKELKLMRMNRGKRLENCARKLCQDTGLDYDKQMGTEEMQVIDLFLKPEFQLICVDAENLRNRIFKGERASIPKVKKYLFTFTNF